MLGSTLSFGSLAVSGFFVISGYLITGSFLNSKSLASYFTKRIFRIYPAFAVASLVCVLIVAPLGGGHFEDGVFSKIGKSIINILILARPKFDGVFVGQHHLDKYSALDGAMWTIQYEFTCYILIALIGVTGGLRKPAFIVCIAALLFGIAIVIPTEILSLLCHAKLFPGLPQSLIRNYRVYFHSLAMRRVKIWIEAMKIHAVAEAMVFSKSLVRRRFRLSHASVRSTTQRRGSTSKPLATSGRLMISMVHLLRRRRASPSLLPA